MIPQRRRRQMRPAIKFERTTFPHLVRLIGKVSFGFCESDVQLSLLTLPPRSQEVGDIRFLLPARSPRPDWIQAWHPGRFLQVLLLLLLQWKIKEMSQRK